jgi:hypothetical protein
MNGLQLACRYAYPTTKLGYCGPKDLSDDIYSCAKTGTCGDLREYILRYEALPIYLKLIAEAHDKDPLDLDVVEAFWIGSKLSNTIKTEEIRRSFIPLMKIPFYKKRLEPKFSAFPDDCHPTHSFHVLLIGSITGVLDNSIGSANSCLVRKGDFDGSRTMVEYLVEKKDHWTVDRKESRGMNIDFIDQSPGDIFSFHWDYAVQKLDRPKAENHTKDLIHHLDIRNRIISELS